MFKWYIIVKSYDDSSFDKLDTTDHDRDNDDDQQVKLKCASIDGWRWW